MAEFHIRIAGHVAAVTSLFESTRDYCRRYLTEDAPDFSVAVTPADLVREQEAANEEADREGLRRRVFSDPFLERTVIQRKIADRLLQWDILLMHGSTVAVDGQAYLFTAKCGTGKSTHTRLWREVFGDRAVMVNDDKPFLHITGSGVTACGAPWSGKHGLDTNVSLPLKGICLLERGTEDRICPASPEALMPMLLHQSHCPPGRETQHRKLVERLAQSTGLWQMECTKTPQAALTAYRAMSGWK